MRYDYTLLWSLTPSTKIEYKIQPRLQIMSKKEKNNQNNNVKSLGVILRHFVGLELTVELKNGRIYQGQLHDADDYMNLVIQKSQPDLFHAHSLSATARCRESSSLTSSTLQNIDFSMVHIRASSIRYVVFPDNADLPKLVRLGMDRVTAASDKYARGKRTTRSSTT